MAERNKDLDIDLSDIEIPIQQFPERKSSLQIALESIDLDDPGFPKKLKDAEEQDLSHSYNLFSDLYYKKFEREGSRFFLLRSLQHNYNALNCRRDLNTSGTFLSKIAERWLNLGVNEDFPLSFREHCFRNAFSFCKRAIANMRPQYQKRERVLSYVGNTLSRLHKLSSDKNDNFSIECLVTAIACSELCRDLGNNNQFNYQAIGRQYYELQSLIEKAERQEIRGISPDMIRKVIKNVLEWNARSNGSSVKPFNSNQGGLSKILSLDNRENPNFGKQMNLISLQNALEAFERSAYEGDTDPGNKSYQAMCWVGISRLNKILKIYDGNEIREKLEGAERFLSEVLEDRLNQSNIGKGIDKDYTRLSECQIRLTDLTYNLITKKELYRQSIYNNLQAGRLLLKKQRVAGRKISKTDIQEKTPKIYSFIATGYFKLAEFSHDMDLKNKYFRKASRYFDKAKDAGDDSEENRSKNGFCIYKLLRSELIGRISREEIAQRVRKAKGSLEEGVKLYRKSPIYPLVLLYYLSKDVEEGIIPGNLEEFGLDESSRYVMRALEIYTANKKWAVKQLSESANFVCESLDDYGILEGTFVLKHGKTEELARERKVTKDLRDILKNELPNNGYFVPKPHGIIEHKDSDKRLSGSYYAMSRKRGVTLDDFLSSEKRTKDEKSDVLTRVVDYLAFIHARVPRVGKQEDYFRKTKAKLEELERITGTGYNIKKSILNNYAPIVNSFKEATLVLNKDAHPENWIIVQNGNIIAIDFGKDELVPIEFDLVNLMEYGENVDDKEKNKYLEVYDLAREHYGSAQSDTNRLRYLNAVVHRAISLVTAWSAPKRESMHFKRQAMLNKALCAIDKVKIEYKKYYSRYASQYEGIKRGLNGIIESFAS